MSARLAAHFGPRWHERADLGLQPYLRRQLARAPLDCQPLGFWSALLNNRYETTLWRPALRSAFAGATGPLTRKRVHARLLQARALDNRITHGEVPGARELRRARAAVAELLGWLSPAASA